MRTTLPRQRAGLAVISVCLLALLLVTMLAAGCSNGGNGGTTSTAGTNPSTSVSETGTSTAGTDLSTTTSVSLALSDTEKELAKTAHAQNALSGVMQKANAADNDPRFAIVYGLHARAQALGVLELLQKGDATSVKTSDSVMLDIYHLLNLARDVAAGEVATKLAAARVIADKIGAPSDHLDEATQELHQFVDTTAWLIDEANTAAGVSTTTTT